MLIHVRKIFDCLSNAVVKVPRNCGERTFNITVIKYFWNDTLHKKMTITATEIVPNQLLSYPVVSKQKNKNENKEYYGTFISFKIHLYSKQGRPIILLVSLVLYLHV